MYTGEIPGKIIHTGQEVSRRGHIPGAVNIPEWALEPGNEITLVLLAENKMLFNAPRVASVEEATSGSAQQAAWEYWSIYR